MLDANGKERKAVKWCKNDNGLFLPENYTVIKKIDVKKKRTLKEQIRWIFDNITIVVLLPSFLGAVWQILELSSINVAYLRFFSVSQILVDGILILSLLILLIVISKIIMVFVKFSFENKIKRFEDKDLLKRIEKKLPKAMIKSIIVSILLVGSMTYFIPMLFSPMFPKSPIFTIFLLAFTVMGITLYLADTAVLVITKIRNDQSSEHDVNRYIRAVLDKYKNYIYWSTLISMFLIIITLPILLKIFSQNFILPINLYNTKYLESIIYKEFKTKDYSIKYFNDKYTFVELCTVKKCSHKLDKEIIIYPTEKVLFKTTYGKVWTGYFTTYKPVNR